MGDCVRKGKFGGGEIHICFFCFVKFSPGNGESCEICDWKKCPNGHCACSTTKETKEALDKFYDLFCKPNNYSLETKAALFYMVKTFHDNCLGCLS